MKNPNENLLFETKRIFLTGAQFSVCKQYRFKLWRVWDTMLPSVQWIGLNPSTADEKTDDNTIRRCIGFARRWNCGSIYMTNIFAYRSTDPAVLEQVNDPIGKDYNDSHITGTLKQASIVVAAWGVHGSLLNRSEQVKSLLRKASFSIYCLGTTKDGEPKHPLYLSYSTEREIFLNPEGQGRL